jgi:hypothetical protein
MSDDRPIAKFLRLQNGDDVIAETIEMEDEDGIVYTLCHPLKVVYMPTETTGYLSVMFMPWVFPKICDEQIFTIHAEDVMLITDVSEKMNIYYWDSVQTYTDKSQYVQEEPEPQESSGMTDEEEYELYNKIMEKIGSKRTMH